jgi:mRNA-degrading endonuclease RelE of RelBE toxin-antitoxin system
MVRMSQKARIAMQSMVPEDRARIQRHIKRLERLPDGTPVIRNAKKIPGVSDPLYLFRASPRLRIIFRFDDDEAEVVDIVTRDRLERMHQYFHEKI